MVKIYVSILFWMKKIDKVSKLNIVHFSNFEVSAAPKSFKI